MLIPLDEKIIPSRVARKLRREFYETPELSSLQKFIKPSDRVLELGAGIGYISTFLAKFMDVSNITVVEANPVLCDYISDLHAKNDVTGARILNGVVLSDERDLPESGTTPFYVTDPFWSYSLRKPKNANATKIDVPVFRLSEVVADAKPTVIVCDIKGGEVDLFNSVDLTGVRYVHLELHTRITGALGVTKLFDAMHRNGFFYH